MWLSARSRKQRRNLVTQSESFDMGKLVETETNFARCCACSICAGSRNLPCVSCRSDKTYLGDVQFRKTDPVWIMLHFETIVEVVFLQGKDATDSDQFAFPRIAIPTLVSSVIFVGLARASPCQLHLALHLLAKTKSC